MKNNLVKTTIRINSALLLMAKKQALNEGKTLQSFIQQAIAETLSQNDPQKTTSTKKRITFTDKNIGVKIPLTRENLYREL